MIGAEALDRFADARIDLLQAAIGEPAAFLGIGGLRPPARLLGGGGVAWNDGHHLHRADRHGLGGLEMRHRQPAADGLGHVGRRAQRRRVVLGTVDQSQKALHAVPLDVVCEGRVSAVTP